MLPMCRGALGMTEGPSPGQTRELGHSDLNGQACVQGWGQGGRPRKPDRAIGQGPGKVVF